MISLVKKDYDSTKIYRKTQKKGASQTYDTPSRRGLLVSRPCTATLGNNLYIHALIWREYPRVGRPKDMLKCKFRYSVESRIYNV